MTSKWQSMLAGAISALFLLLLPTTSPAQDLYQNRNLAWNLSEEAGESWNAVRQAWNSAAISDDDPVAVDLYQSMRDFNRQARQFARRSQYSSNPSQLRRQARNLVSEATRIDALMNDVDLPPQVLQEWAEVEDSLQNLAFEFNLPYDRDRSLARTDY